MSYLPNEEKSKKFGFEIAKHEPIVRVELAPNQFEEVLVDPLTGPWTYQRDCSIRPARMPNGGVKGFADTASRTFNGPNAWQMLTSTNQKILIVQTARTNRKLAEEKGWEAFARQRYEILSTLQTAAA
eukprot:gnl/TRDRNA2_/TRDRNA2_133902_c0_seq1.p1 gnl/TRDRNA2_/TRDRNA2_133902_c0~~gnl/TRDRNA2_/TRDRNA2_133902_c0_seq1.p1  ORF type:complete len:128 (+),score=23.54 gnl/TRDRNA2_/TRDRNA2_133902_c0_seq1:81-464(+)